MSVNKKTIGNYSQEDAKGSCAEFGIPASEMLSNPIEKIPCLVEPFLQKEGLACLAGGSDTGKSSFLRNLSMCIAGGKDDFLGFKINAVHRRAIYVSSEDGENSTNSLINKQNNDLQLEPSQLEGLLFVFDTFNLLDKLDKMLTEQPVDIIVIDAFADVFGDGNSNDIAQVRAFLNGFSQLAQKYKCLILFLHHCGKGKEDLRPSKNSLLGSQGIEAKMRLVLLLTNDHAEANIRHLCIVKGNYLPEDAKNESYKLRFTENMVYENTGERVPFDDLKQKGDVDREKYLKAKELRDKGKKMEEIAKIIGYKNKGSVSKLLKKYDEMAAEKTDEVDED